MKKFNITCLLAIASSFAMANDLVSTASKLENAKVVEEASDTAKWTFPGSVGVNANQAYFNDYSTDGSGASVALDAYLNLNANYKRKKVLWENSLAAKYGMIYSTEFTGEDLVRKNLDELIINTKYGYKVSKYWYASAFANLETQFTQGYEYLEDVNGQDSASTISHFFAPAYIKVSLGMEYIPNKYFSAFLSPITARFTVCRLDELGDKYGMEVIKEGADALYDEDGDLIRKAIPAEYKHLRTELGAYAKLKSDFDITKSLHFLSTLEGFYAYNKAVQSLTDEYIDFCEKQNPEGLLDYTFDETDFDVDNYKYEDIHGWYIKWKLEFLLKVSKYVNLSFKTQLKYDNAERKALEGKYAGLPQAKLQFWESASIGVAYTFK